MNNIVELDVRPYLRKKLEPFKQIMDAVGSLKQDDLFVLHATFNPRPLLGVLKAKGYVNKQLEVQSDHWISAFAKSGSKEQLEQLDLGAFAGRTEEEWKDEDKDA